MRQSARHLVGQGIGGLGPRVEPAAGASVDPGPDPGL